MKQLIARTLTSLTLVVVWLAATAQAQSTPLVIKVKIPFEFSIGDRTSRPATTPWCSPCNICWRCAMRAGKPLHPHSPVGLTLRQRRLSAS